jgi:hypothetical protein
MVLITAGLGALVVGVWGDALPDPALWPIFASASPNTPATPIHVDPLPVPSATEAFLARGRVLFNSGHLRDAMREVERIPLGDRLYPEAQRLRADIQRQLLALAVAEQGTTAVGVSQLPQARPPE